MSTHDTPAATAASAAGSDATPVPAPRPARDWPKIWLVSLSACVAIGFLNALHGYIGFTLAGEPAGGFTMPAVRMTWWDMVARTLPSWTWLGLILPGAIWMSDRWPLEPGRLRRHLPVHLLAAVVFAAIYTLGAGTLRYLLFVPAGAAGYGAVLLRYYAVYYNLFFVYYLLVAGVTSALGYYKLARVKEAERAAAARVASEARLESLRRQLQPHFLFNVLNSISSLVLQGHRRDAVRTLADLSQLLRAAFSEERPMIRLEEELDLIRRYVGLHRLRLGDRLRFRESIGPGAEDARVPAFLLQPLVENAVRHGIAPLRAVGTLELRAEAVGGRLVLEVTNPVPEGAAQAGGTGVGLRNTRERIERSFPGHGRFEFRRENGRAVATVDIPLEPMPERRAPEHEAAHADRR